jgi:hypothetical protein
MREFEMKNSVLGKMIVCLGALLFVLTPLYGEKSSSVGAGKRPLPPPGKGRGPHHYGMRRNAVFWRVFSQLSEPERKKMQELQRNEPEKFTAEMRKLAEKYEQRELAWRNKLTSLIEKYRKSSDKNERSKLKAEITVMEKERFDQRIAGLTRTIAGAKRRVAMMEEDLKKRKDKAAAIVDARVEALLNGEIPVMPPRRSIPPRKDDIPRKIRP